MGLTAAYMNVSLFIMAELANKRRMVAFAHQPSRAAAAKAGTRNAEGSDGLVH